MGTFLIWLTIGVSVGVALSAIYRFWNNKTLQILGESNLIIVGMLSIGYLFYHLDSSPLILQVFSLWVFNGALFLLLWNAGDISLPKRISLVLFLWISFYISWIALVLLSFGIVSWFSLSSYLLVYSIITFE